MPVDFGSGFPFTRTAGFYEDLQLSNNVNTNINGENGQLGILYENKLNRICCIRVINYFF